jgi:RNA polymerase sigma-70 factor, ECF subfamily
MDHQKAAIPLAMAEASLQFEDLFKTYFKALYTYAYSIVKDDVIAEEMVQNVFCRLWEKRDQINIVGSVKSYLYRSVHNESLNYLKQHKQRSKHLSYIASRSTEAEMGPDGAEYMQLRERFQLALNDLPEQCRTVFHLSRNEELNYKEIAETMGITISTVKNHINKALRVLRIKLTDYLPVIFLLLSMKKS